VVGGSVGVLRMISDDLSFKSLHYGNEASTRAEEAINTGSDSCHRLAIETTEAELTSGSESETFTLVFLI